MRSCAGLVRFEDIPGDGAFRLLLVDELNRRGWASCVSAAYTRALLKTASSGEAFLEKALTGKDDRNFKPRMSGSDKKASVNPASAVRIGVP